MLNRRESYIYIDFIDLHAVRHSSQLKKKFSGWSNEVHREKKLRRFVFVL